MWQKPRVLLLAVLVGCLAFAPASAGNLLANPTFDSPILPGNGLGPWQDFGFDSSWSPIDSYEIEESGSAKLRFAYVGLQNHTIFFQCVAVDESDILTFGGRVMMSQSDDDQARVGLGLTFHDNDTCDSSFGGLIGEEETEGLGPADVLGNWRGLMKTGVSLPPGTLSVRVSGEIVSPGLGNVQALFDDLFLVAVTACQPGPHRLCLDAEEGDGRFSVEVEFETDQGGGAVGMGDAVALGPLGISQGGIFSFFDSTNPEMLVKVVDGCGTNGHRWVFYSAGTNVALRTTVVDTVSGEVWFRGDPDLHLAEPVADTAAFSCD